MEMKPRWILVSIIAGIAVTAPAVLSAQQPKGKQQRQELDPQLYNEELTPGQIERAQDPSDSRPAPKAAPPKAKQQAGAPPRAVACSGPFSKDSSHLKLAAAFKSENVEFAEIDSGGTKVMASIIYPKEPKRRLEV